MRAAREPRREPRREPIGRPMPHPRRFRFGLKVRSAESGAALAELARRAESLGYASLLLSDHPTHPQLAPIATAAALACATTRVRIGASVLANDFRHPVLLAKEIAALDRLSGGRAELGIGTGWKREEYESLGIPFERAGLRIERLAEALQILRSCLAGKRFDFEGRHYRVQGLSCEPPPVQARLPILVGGGGRKLLSLAAREADIVGINPAVRSGAHDAATDADATAAATDEKLAWVREAAGARYAELELSMQVYVACVSEDRAQADRAAQARYAFPIEQVREVPYVWAGSVGEICDALEARRERWHASYWIVPDGCMESLAPIVARLAGR